MTRAFIDDNPGSGAAGTIQQTQGLASLLRERTAAIHREAERAGFIADLIRGRATRGGYALFLRSLVPAYVALEDALAAWRDDRVLRAFADPRLGRLSALISDVVAIAGADWETQSPPLPQALAYAAAVRAAAGDPLRLLAHAYARYLGDLSGGQILKPILARTLGLGPGDLAFYDFPEIEDLAAAKSAIREALDAVRVDETTAAMVVAEAIAAFRHNIAVSQAIQTAAG